MLRDKNGDLGSLRAQMERFNCGSLRNSFVAHPEAMPHYYHEVQQIFAEAHRVLTSSFNCSDATHDEHSASIGLDMKYGEEMTLDMAITYIRRCNE
jgi:predicted ester cyclase